MSKAARFIAASMVVGCLVTGALVASRGCGDDVARTPAAPHADAATAARVSSSPATNESAARPILRRGGRHAPTAGATPAPSGTVLVRVTGADDDAPIAGATVLVPDLEDEGLLRRTDAAGVARFGPLEPNKWEFRASAPGRIAEYGTCVVAAGAETKLALRLAPSVDLAVRVEERRTGAPVAGAKVHRVVVGAAIGLDAVTDADGRCTMPSMPDAVIKVTASAEGFDVAELLLHTAPRGAQPTDVVVRLAPPGRMTGVIRAPDGTPVPRARVRVAIESSRLEPSNVRYSVPRSTSMNELADTADDDGHYVVTGLIHGRRYHACADDAGTKFGWSLTAEDSLATPDAPEVTQDFVLRPLGGLVIRVTKPDGTPVQDAALMFRSGGGLSSLASDANRPSLNGVFSFAGWNPGEVDFSVFTHDAGTASRRVVVPAGETLDVTVELGTSSEIRGIVVDEAGRPIAEATVSILASSSGDARIYNGFKTDAGGAFRGSVGGPGPTSAEVSAPGHVNATAVPLTAPCDDARIVLRRAATLTFRVAGDDVTPFNVMPVVFFDGLDSPVYGRPDADGRVRFDFEPRGAVQAQVFAYGRAPVVVAANLVAGEVCDLGDIRFVQPRRVSGRVVDAAGRPVAGALVGIDDHTGRMTLGMQKLLGVEETDGDGRFAGDFAPPSGALPLRVEAAGFLVLHAMPTIGSDAPIVLTLARGGLAWGEVVDAAGAPIPDVKIRVIDANGADAASVAADSHGVFDARVAPGRYVFRADGCDDATVVLVEGGDAHVRLVGRSR